VRFVLPCSRRAGIARMREVASFRRTAFGAKSFFSREKIAFEHSSM
jgi:hypothetical protein